MPQLGANNKYVKPDGYAIRKAIEEGRIAEVNAEIDAIRNYIKERLKEKWEKKLAAENQARIKALEEIEVGGAVFFIGSDPRIEFGAQGQKVRHRRTRMTVKFGDKNWDCPYNQIQPYYPSQDQITSHNIKQRVAKLFIE